KPDLKGAKRLAGVKFCEATRQAITESILLDKESISCPGAQYAFGWSNDYRNSLLDACRVKRKTTEGIVESMLSSIPHMENSFNYIGLNTEGEPDLVMSYIVPQEAMELIRIYHERQGRNLDVSLCSMMSICAGVAARVYLKKEVCLSFGCVDSRKFADIRRENLAIGIPNRLFNLFLD
ncbi:DUF169 domain-containing protein, partial [Candidatus Omnitrophota bacterium]